MKPLFYLSALICCSLILTMQSCCEDDSGSPATSPLAGCCENPAIDTTFGNAKVYIPNVFTPNTDGINDIFAVLGDSIKTIVHLEINDISNQTVFMRDNIPYNEYSDWLHFNHYWDGLSNEELVLGLFSYSTTLESENGMIETFNGMVCNYPCGFLGEENRIPIDGCQFPTQLLNGRFSPILDPGESNGDDQACFE